MPVTVVIQAVFVYLILCGVAAFFGRRRRIGYWGFFFLSVLVTPIMTTLFIFVAAPAPAPRRPAHRRG